MRVVAVREVKASLSEYLEKSQRDRVLMTKHGRPAALVIGVEGEDLEDLLTMGNPRFWQMIEDRRRKSRTSTLAEVRAAYGVRRRTVSRGRSGLRRVRSLGLSARRATTAAGPHSGEVVLSLLARICRRPGG